MEAQYKEAEGGESIEIEVEKAIIHLVRGKKYLYDTRMKDYKDIIKRNNAFAAIGEQLGMTGEEASKKWKQLRDRFNKERKLIREKTRSGAAGSANAKCRWKFYEVMQFLTDYVKPRCSTSNLPPELPALEDDIETPESCPSTPSSYVSDLSLDISGLVTETPQKPTKFRRIDHPEEAVSAIKAVGAAISNRLQTPDNDQFHAFGSIVADQLRAMPLRQSRLAQIKIQQLLFEMEFENK